MPSFLPPQRLLLGPGPSDVSERVLQALARPTIGHLDPSFVQMMDELKDLLRMGFRTNNAMTVPVSAPGSAGMETCFVNLLEAGDTVVVCQNGVFGGRMAENARRVGAKVVLVEDQWGKPVDPEKVRAALRANPDAKALAFVHAETSTGARSDAATLCALAAEHGALSIVDAVTSLAGIELEVDRWGIDAIYSGSQKCLSAPPGLSPVSFSQRAVDVIKGRKSPVQSWFLDLSLVMNYWEGQGARSYHHTAPVNALYGLHEAFVILEEEGLEQSWARHLRNHERLREGFAHMGLELLGEAKYRLPQLNAVLVPDGVDEAQVRRRMLDEHQIEIGAGLGALAGKIWRIGLMGASSQPEKVDRCLTAMRAVLGR